MGFASPERYKRTKGRCKFSFFDLKFKHQNRIYATVIQCFFGIHTTMIVFFFADWQQFVTNKLWAWEQMNLQWARNFTGDIHIVYYDDLVENPNGTLRGILHFIEYPLNQVK